MTNEEAFRMEWLRRTWEDHRNAEHAWADWLTSHPEPVPVSEASEAPFVPEFGQRVRLTSLISGFERAGRLAGQSKIDWWLLNDGDDEPQSYEKENWSITPLEPTNHSLDDSREEVGN